MGSKIILFPFPRIALIGTDLICCPYYPWEYKTNAIMKKVQLFLAVSLCGFGCVLLACGFLCPPLGEIHHSLLIAFGEILTFSGSLIGIDYKYRYKE